MTGSQSWTSQTLLDVEKELRTKRGAWGRLCQSPEAGERHWVVPMQARVFGQAWQLEMLRGFLAGD